jgi:uroporphyrinogen-III synthase
MASRVLVTRPQPGADATARRLGEFGFAPLVLPLTEIRSLPIDPLPRGAAIDAIAVTSSNALRHAPPELIAAFRHKPCFAVGAETAAAARKAGFSKIRIGTGDAAGLARTILDAMGSRSRLLYLCGRVRMSGFEDRLREGGTTIDVAETYDAAEITYSPDVLLSSLGPAPVDAALLYSAKAAARLATLALQPKLRALFSGTAFFCLSERIGTALSGIPDRRILFAQTPDESALLAMLRQRCGNRP